MKELPYMVTGLHYLWHGTPSIRPTNSTVLLLSFKSSICSKSNKILHMRERSLWDRKGGGSLFRTIALPPNWTRSRVQECLRPSCLHLTSSFTGQKEYDLVTVGTTSITQLLGVCGPPSRQRISARACFSVYHLLLGIRSDDFQFIKGVASLISADYVVVLLHSVVCLLGGYKSNASAQ